ncbi:MAG: ABC transporter ATP-binding protein [Angelakisella sp.]|nr:ABC transporter ATP-binding protein [Angelakisella sp.]
MNNDIAIKVSNVSKAYKIYQRSTDRLKESFLRKKLHHDFWALDDISFEIPKGGVVGIVGRNGSGKSTLLQIIAGTLSPTSGTCEIHGKVAALLELGSGFNPEFTGRENVYICGSIYGITRDVMDERISDIEKFADIGQFMDQPVKTYSSGMFARLAFAVNINVDADILIVDEVLSVGDHFFQAKCMSAINGLIKKGVTILLVSHSQATIKALCGRAMLFSKGKLVIQGDCDEVMDRYMAISLSEEAEARKLLENSQQKATEDSEESGAATRYQSICQPDFSKRVTERFGKQDVTFVEAAMFQYGTETAVVESRNKATISLWVQAHKDIDDESEVGVVVRTFEGIDLFALNSFFNSQKVSSLKKGCIVRVDFSFDVLLGPGKYSVAVGFRSPVQGEYMDKAFNAIIFDVVNLSSKTIPLLFDVPSEMTLKVLCDE